MKINIDNTKISDSLAKAVLSREGIIGLTLITFATILMILNISLRNHRLDMPYNSYVIFFIVFPVVFLFSGFGIFIFAYLQGNYASNKKEYAQNLKYDAQNILTQIKQELKTLRNSSITAEVNETKELFEQVKILLENQQTTQLDKNQTQELFSSIRQSFAERINENFFKQLNENITTQVTNKRRNLIDSTLKDFQEIKFRLSNEIEKLSRKANVNLVIGSLTTLVALVALSYIVLQSNIQFVNYTEILYHYIPRLSLIIFIEVFAYFFLRLYKLNLNDMKYFQNELTTIELKLAAITIAINFGKDIDISAIISEISKSERNFILKKGETTVEIEKSRIEKTDLKNLLKSITDITNNKN